MKPWVGYRKEHRAWLAMMIEIELSTISFLDPVTLFLQLTMEVAPSPYVPDVD